MWRVTSVCRAGFNLELPNKRLLLLPVVKHFNSESTVDFVYYTRWPVKLNLLLIILDLYYIIH